MIAKTPGTKAYLRLFPTPPHSPLRFLSPPLYDAGPMMAMATVTSSLPPRQNIGRSSLKRQTFRHHGSWK